MAGPALLIVDVINHFAFEGARPLAAAARWICAPLRALRDRFDTVGYPVVYANDKWTHWQGDFSKLAAFCRERGGAFARLANSLAPNPAHFPVLNLKHSAFRVTALPILLQQLDVEQLAITGIATDSCVLANALDAHMHVYRLWVPDDCTAARTPALQRAAMHLLRRTCSADVATSRGRRDSFRLGRG